LYPPLPSSLRSGHTFQICLAKGKEHLSEERIQVFEDDHIYFGTLLVAELWTWTRLLVPTAGPEEIEGEGFEEIELSMLSKVV
jgi:hypothetical protein